MRTRVVIQSRLSSSRLSGKALMSLAGMPLIELVARRASRSGFEVVVATSSEPYDQLIAKVLEPSGLPTVLGPLDDVLHRFALATSDLAAGDRVVRLTGDNPVVDADLVQEVIDAVEGAGRSYGRVDIEQVAEGLGVEVFSVRQLRDADDHAVDSYDREHVTPWIRRHTDELLFVPEHNPGAPELFRCTVDCLHDYFRVSQLFEGEREPVHVPWGVLVDKLRPQASRVSSARASSPRPLALDARGLPKASGEELRLLFANAADAGVSAVVLDEHSCLPVAIGSNPALRGRFSFHYVLAKGEASEASAAVWRAAATLGVPRLTGVVIEGRGTDEPVAGIPVTDLGAYDVEAGNSQRWWPGR